MTTMTRERIDALNGLATAIRNESGMDDADALMEVVRREGLTLVRFEPTPSGGSQCLAYRDHDGAHVNLRVGAGPAGIGDGSTGFDDHLDWMEKD